MSKSVQRRPGNSGDQAASPPPTPEASQDVVSLIARLSPEERARLIIALGGAPAPAPAPAPQEVKWDVDILIEVRQNEVRRPRLLKTNKRACFGDVLGVLEIIGKAINNWNRALPYDEPQETSNGRGN